MTVRKINNPKQNNQLDSFDLPKDKPGVIYVRQSRDAQVKDNIHSFEMQTELFEKYFRDQGFTGTIIILTDDEGMSGTLDIHKRPGMTKTMKMIKGEILVEGKKIGWVAAIHVNRLFRDQWMINPDVFMKECYDNHVWVITLRMAFNFQHDYDRRLFRMEAEESARHLEWMKMVLGGGKRAASAKGYYDGRVLAPGYIVDRSDTKRKKIIPYKPHILPTQWLFQRLVELDFSVWSLCHEIDALPYLYPKFESWVDPKTVRRFTVRAIEDGPFAGNYKPTRNGIMSLLTNPVYIGWWIPIEGEIVKNNHPAIIDEDIFWLVFHRISNYDLEGNPQKLNIVTRNGGVKGILKKVLVDERGRHFYAAAEKGGRYSMMETNGLIATERKTFSIRLIDSIFLERFFERLRGWTGFEDWAEQIKQKEEGIKAGKDNIRKLIEQAKREWDEAMNTLTNPDIEKTDQMVRFLAKKCKELEEKIAELEHDFNTPVEDAEDEVYQYKIATLLPEVIDAWDELPFTQRLTIVSAFVRSVVIQQVSPSWLILEIQWKRSDWGTEYRHIPRENTDKQYWTEEEDAILQEMWPSTETLTILQKLPTRNYDMIATRAYRRGIRRVIKNKAGIIKKYEALSVADWEYMDTHNLTMDNFTTWSQFPVRRS